MTIRQRYIVIVALGLLILGLVLYQARGSSERQLFVARFKAQIPPDTRSLLVEGSSPLLKALTGEYSAVARLELPPASARTFVDGLGGSRMDTGEVIQRIWVTRDPAQRYPAWMQIRPDREPFINGSRLYGSSFLGIYGDDGSLTMLLDEKDPAAEFTWVYLFVFIN